MFPVNGVVVVGEAIKGCHECADERHAVQPPDARGDRLQLGRQCAGGAGGRRQDSLQARQRQPGSDRELQQGITEQSDGRTRFAVTRRGVQPPHDAAVRRRHRRVNSHAVRSRSGPLPDTQRAFVVALPERGRVGEPVVDRPVGEEGVDPGSSAFDTDAGTGRWFGDHALAVVPALDGRDIRRRAAIQGLAVIVANVPGDAPARGRRLLLGLPLPLRGHLTPPPRIPRLPGRLFRES
ncbi:protein of unknown function (plasmid) [Rhodovastum atsumiense]|nr:protein of unknown function [Rhodovastum atsumiense]